MEREGAVPQDCSMKGVCEVPLAYWLQQHLGIATDFPNIYVLLLSPLKPIIKPSQNVFQMLFLTCCVLKLINILHFNQQIKLKNTIVDNGPSKMEFYGSRHLKSCLEQISSALAATFLTGISTIFQFAQSLCHTLLTETTFSNNKNTLHGSWSCFSPMMETEKQRQEPAFQPLPFLEIRCSQQLLHTHISLLPDKIFIKNRMKFVLLSEKLQGSKTEFRPQLDSPSSIILFPFILFGQSSFLHCTAS